MSRTYQVSFPAAGNPADLIALAERHFSALGYVPQKKSATKITLKKDGGYWTFDGAKVKHDLEVCATGVALVFEFTAPWGWTYTKGDGPKLDAIAAGFVGAVRALAAQPYQVGHHQPVQVVVQQHGAHTIPQQVIERQVVVVRCKFCQQLAPADLQTCQHCGAAKFC